jgi:hypothetical protein
VRVASDGRRVAVRYAGWTTRDFGGFPHYAYDDTRPEPPVQRATMPPASRATPSAAASCSSIAPGARAPAVTWSPAMTCGPAGSVGPDLSTLADRKLPDAYLYQHLWIRGSRSRRR